MKSNQITLIELKDNTELFKIATNIINKYSSTTISYQEIVEIINSSKMLQAELQQQNYQKLSTILSEHISKEIKIRIKSGEISIVKNEFLPLLTFIKSPGKNHDKVIFHINRILCALEIDQEPEILNAIYQKLDFIRDAITKTLEMDNSSFFEYPIYKTFVQIAKTTNHDLPKQIEFTSLNNAYLIEKLQLSGYANKVKNFLEKHDFTEREIFVVLLRFGFFDYEPIPVDITAKVLHVNAERIKIDQERIIQKIFLSKLTHNFAKLLPHSNTVYKTLVEWHNTGFDEMLLRENYKDINSKKTNAMLSIPSILKLNKEDVAKLINRLNKNDQSFIQEFYNEDFEILENKKYLINIQQKNLIIRKLKKLKENPDYIPRKKRCANLSDDLNIPKEELKLLLLDFAPTDQKFINNIYTEEFEHKKISLTLDERSRLNLLKNEIVNYYNNRSIDPKRNRNLYKKLNISKEQLLDLIEKLNPEEQLFIQYFYNVDFDEVIASPSKSEREIIKTIINNIKTLMKGEKTAISNTKRNRPLYKLVNMDKETLIKHIAMLSEHDQALINTYYNEDYYFQKPSGTTKKEAGKIASKLMVIRNKIKRLHTDPNYHIQNNKSKATTLYKLLDISKEDLEELIKKLSIEEQDFLKNAYSEEFELISKKDLDDKELGKYRSKLAYIRKKLRILHVEPDRNFSRNNPKQPRESKSKTLYELLGVSAIELALLIKRLLPEEQVFISTQYDESYHLIKNKDISEEERNRKNAKLAYIRNKLRKLKTNPNLIIKPREKREPKIKVTLYSKLNITKDELLKAVDKLKEEDKKILLASYNDNFESIYKFNMPKEERIKLNAKLNQIRKKLKEIINPQSTQKIQRRKNLCETLQISKDELDTAIKRLPKKDQLLLKEIFDENYNPIENNYDSKFLNKEMPNIKRKLHLILANKDYIPKESDTLLNRLNVDINTLQALLTLASDTDKEYLSKFFDFENGYIKMTEIDEKTKYKVNQIIVPKLKRYLKNGLKKNVRSKKEKTAIETFLIHNAKSEKSVPNQLNILELIIMMSLTTGEEYSTSSIAKFLGIDEAVVRDIIKNYLLTCQEKFEFAIKNQVINLEKPIVREIKKDEKRN